MNNLHRTFGYFGRYRILSVLFFVIGCAEVNLEESQDSGVNQNLSVESDDSSDSTVDSSDTDSDTGTNLPSSDNPPSDTDTSDSSTPESDVETDTSQAETDTPTSADSSTDDPGGLSSDEQTTDSADETTDSKGTDIATVQLGSPCTLDNAVKRCGSVEKCVDGYCCDSICDQPCEACDVAGEEGTCTVYEANVDPDSECGVCQVCNGDKSAPSCVSVGYGEDLKGDCDACRFCNGSDTEPHCTPVPSGQDPFDDCSEDTSDTCGQTGLCDGLGMCALTDVGTPCKKTSCSETDSLAKQFEFRCDGKGTCIESTQICGGYRCDQAADACSRDCESGECSDGFSCIDERCVISIPKQDGETCLSNDECDSQFCVDGVCCNSACSDMCWSCDQKANIGVCSPIPPDSDPKNDCPSCFVCNDTQQCVPVPAGEDFEDDCREDTSLTGCGPSGFCNGHGGCAFKDENTACGTSICNETNALLTLFMCDGNGNCDSSTTGCDGYQCADDTKCDSDCNEDADCADGAMCKDSVCVAQQEQGAYCRTDSACKSGFCVDGVCCDSVCDEPCMRCDLAQKNGVCTSAVSQTDPDDDCPPCEVCEKGECVPAAKGSDPKQDCSAGGHSECAYTGLCDGKSSCEIHGETQACGTACNGDTAIPLFCSGEFVGIDACQIEGEPQPCADNILCRDDIPGCPDVCTSNKDCLTTDYCDPDTGTCLPRKLTGSNCKENDECLTAYCVDEVCCDGLCDGICEACNLEDTQGQCTPHAVGSDPDDECPTCQGCDGTQKCGTIAKGPAPQGDCTDDTPCGHTGQCIDGSCEYYSEGLTCAEMTCAGPSGEPDVTRYQCDGEGECRPQEGQTCGGYRCESKSSCLDKCESADDCAASFSCNDGECTSDNENGTPCILNSECRSNYCVDGFCCDSACDALCEACDIDGFEGICKPEPNGSYGTLPNEKRTPDCGVCEVCDGEGECRAVDLDLHPTDEIDPKNLCGDSEETASCGFTGDCESGTGECAYFATDVVCNETCPSPGLENYLWHCDGAGGCLMDLHGEICGDHLTCQEDEKSCRTLCRNQSHCDEATYCDEGQCLPKKIGGETCDAAFECLSGNCPQEDGVCCDLPCTGLCESCDQKNNIGLCLPIPTGEDPDNECDDKQFCTLNDFCNADQECDHSGSPCDEEDDNICNDCNESTNSCIQPQGTACGSDALSPCTKPDTCDSNGTCLANHFPDETECAADSNDCTYDICLSGTCQHPDSGHSDADNVCDAMDNCPLIDNNHQEDSDNDGVGDACDECPTDPEKTVGPCLTAAISVARYNDIIEIMFHIANHGSKTVNLQDITLRYWYTISNPFNYQLLECYWVDPDKFPSQCDNIRRSPESAVFHPVDRPKANYYMEAAFVGNLYPLEASSNGSAGSSGYFKLAWHTDSFSQFNPSLDYSYDNYSSMTVTKKVTLYQNGILIWGEEP